MGEHTLSWNDALGSPPNARHAQRCTGFGGTRYWNPAIIRAKIITNVSDVFEAAVAQTLAIRMTEMAKGRCHSVSTPFTYLRCSPKQCENTAILTGGRFLVVVYEH
ncbi:hypothetical protein AAG570_002812 [Ranatra chinensis]|uniref:Uncharacterized protein n=1 Tax=Ranatra chinensis TaxID=642074 RepID=A0ABD0Y5K3_9HEMI